LERVTGTPRPTESGWDVSINWPVTERRVSPGLASMLKSIEKGSLKKAFGGFAFPQSERLPRLASESYRNKPCD